MIGSEACLDAWCTAFSPNPTPTEEEIRKGLDGNICRCTGYEKIIQAVQRASQMMDTSKIENAGGMG